MVTIAYAIIFHFPLHQQHGGRLCSVRVHAPPEQGGPARERPSAVISLCLVQLLCPVGPTVATSFSSSEPSIMLGLLSLRPSSFVQHRPAFLAASSPYGLPALACRLHRVHVSSCIQPIWAACAGVSAWPCSYLARQPWPVFLAALRPSGLPALARRLHRVHVSSCIALRSTRGRA